MLAEVKVIQLPPPNLNGSHVEIAVVVYYLRSSVNIDMHKFVAIIGGCRQAGSSVAWISHEMGSGRVLMVPSGCIESTAIINIQPFPALDTNNKNCLIIVTKPLFP